MGSRAFWGLIGLGMVVIKVLPIRANDFAISTANGIQCVPAVAKSESNWLVVWQDNRNLKNEGDLYAQIVSFNGELIDTDFVISIANFAQYKPAVASNGVNYLVVWEDGRNGDVGYEDIYGQLVVCSGGLVDTNFPISTAPGQQLWSDVASDGENFLVVWTDYRNGSPDIYGQLLTGSGSLIDTSFPISTANSAQWAPEVVWSDSNYLVVWCDYRDWPARVRGQRISHSGALSGNDFIVSTDSTPHYYPDVAWDGLNYLVVWHNNTGSSRDIYGQLISNEGVAVGTTFSISTANSAQYYPRVAVDGTTYLVIWIDERICTPFYQCGIYGQRVALDGRSVDTNFCITTTAGTMLPFALNTVSDKHFVIWSDYRDMQVNSDIYGMFIPSMGIEKERSYSEQSRSLEVYPNPFLKYARIIPSCNKIYDLSGRLIGKTEQDTWNGKDINGKNLNAGIYFLKAKGYKPVKVVKLR